MEAWLSWLEHTVHIREVTGSSPVASTTLYQSAPLADWFFLLSVSATGSKVRSAPLMGESCPSTTRNLKDFSGCFFVFRSIVLAQSVAGNKR